MREIFAALLCLFVSMSVTAAPIFDQTGTELVGISNVSVNGELYDIAFAEGTCDEVFGDCSNVQNFAFQTQADALAARQALLQEIIDNIVPAFLGQTSRNVLGCHSVSCIMHTPFDPQPLSVIVQINDRAIPQNNHIQFSNFDSDSSGVLDVNWAVWTKQASEVPQPLPLALLAIGVWGFAARRPWR